MRATASIPWSYNSEIGGITDRNGVVIVGAVEFEEAEVIVRAVNSHEALITAVEAAIIHINNSEVKRMLKTILAQVEKQGA